jgi:hypothetical protein
MIAQRDWVLGKLTTEDHARIAPALEQAADAAEVWAREGAVAAMNRFNGKAGEKARDRKQDDTPTRAESRED